MLSLFAKNVGVPKFLSLGTPTFIIEPVDTANDPYDARDKILKHRPDVMTCDIQMPRMNGIEFIRQLLPQYPIAVIVISTISGAVFDAIAAGAVDFIAKPVANSPDSIRDFVYDLIYKVKIASTARIVNRHADSPEEKTKTFLPAQHLIKSLR